MFSGKINFVEYVAFFVENMHDNEDGWTIFQGIRWYFYVSDLMKLYSGKPRETLMTQVQLFARSEKSEKMHGPKSGRWISSQVNTKQIVNQKSTQNMLLLPILLFLNQSSPTIMRAQIIICATIRFY